MARLPYKDAVKRRPKGSCYCNMPDDECYARGHWNPLPLKGKLTYVSINGKTLARNSRTGLRDPVIAVRTSKNGKPRYVSKLRIEGPCELVYQHDAPILKCGARCVLIVKGEVYDD